VPGVGVIAAPDDHRVIRARHAAEQLIDGITLSEISFPIQKRVEFGRLGELDLVDPASALGVFINEFRLADQRLVYTKDFAAYG
jgi:hypothetical protein